MIGRFIISVFLPQAKTPVVCKNTALTNYMKNIILSIFLTFLTFHCVLGEANKHHLSNGITVLLNKDTSSDVIGLEVFVNSGSYFESEDNNGINNLSLEMLLKGTKTKDLYKFAEETEAMGTIIGVEGGTDYSSINMICTKKNLSKSVLLTADLIINPSFPELELVKLKKTVISDIKAKEDNNFKYSYQLLREMVYAGTSFRFDALGTEKNVEKAGVKDITDWHKKYFTGNNILITVSGDFFEEDLLALLERNFGVISVGEKSVISHDGKVAILKPLEKTVKTDKNQSFVLVGFGVPGLMHADYPALKVLSAALGGGMSSRLFNTLREKEGLAYEIGSFYPTAKEDGVFVFYAGTRKENIEKLKAGIIRELEAAKKSDAISEDEIEKAKRYIVGNFVLSHQTNSKKAWYLGLYEEMGKGYEYDLRYSEEIKKVGVKEVREVLNKYFVNPVVLVTEAGK